MCEIDAVLDETVKSRLAAASTATLTTLLYRRGLKRVFMKGVRPLALGKPRMVGPAYTLRMIPSREDIDSLFERDSRTDLQRLTVEAVPPGAVLVIDSRGDASAASGGALLALRLQMRGVEGVVTDGGFRDSPEIGAFALRAFHTAPSAPPVLIAHRPHDVQIAIGCGGVAVWPDDIIVGDDEGVVVIPRHMAPEIADEAVQKEDVEAFIASELRGGRSLMGLYPPDAEAMSEYRAWVASGRPQQETKPQ